MKIRYLSNLTIAKIDMSLNELSLSKAKEDLESLVVKFATPLGF